MKPAKRLIDKGLPTALLWSGNCADVPRGHAMRQMSKAKRGQVAIGVALTMVQLRTSDFARPSGGQ